MQKRAATDRRFTPQVVVEGELDLRRLSGVLWRRKWRIILPTLLVAAGTFVAVNLLTPRYKSEARVLIESRENIFLRPEAEKTSFDRTVVLKR